MTRERKYQKVDLTWYQKDLPNTHKHLKRADETWRYIGRYKREHPDTEEDVEASWANVENKQEHADSAEDMEATWANAQNKEALQATHKDIETFQAMAVTKNLKTTDLSKEQKLESRIVWHIPDHLSVAEAVSSSPKQSLNRAFNVTRQLFP